MAFITQNAQLQISAGLAKQFPTNPIPQVAFSGATTSCQLGTPNYERNYDYDEHEKQTRCHRH